MNSVTFVLQGWRGPLFWSAVAPLLVACLPGVVVIGFLALKAEEVIGDLLTGHARRENIVFLVTVLVVWAFSAVASYRLIGINRLVLGLLSAVGCGLFAAVVAAGLVFWVQINLAGRLLMLSAQILLGLLLLRAGREAWEVVGAFRGNSIAAARQLALAAVGSLLAAALAGAVALGRGLELSLVARPHWFYVLVVPAVAGFGAASRSHVQSKLFGVLTSVVVLLTIAYYFGTVLFGVPEILCDMHIRNPHYQVLGFDWEPWHWSQRDAWRWIFAPGALTELSVLHVVAPVPNVGAQSGTYCIR